MDLSLSARYALAARHPRGDSAPVNIRVRLSSGITRPKASKDMRILIIEDELRLQMHCAPL